MQLSRVEIITGISKIEPLKKALGKFRITGMTVYQVLGCGVQHGTQEFEVADDGIVEQPRIISGAILDDYMQMAALSELNMHFVNSHFMHPDDLLDKDRGAALGWEKLRARLDEYMTWMNESAPSLRNLTGSELAGAVQRYGALTVDKEITDQEIRIHLGNFYDEAYLMVRINDGTPGQVTGGELTNVTGNLYLLHAQESEVVIERN